LPRHVLRATTKKECKEPDFGRTFFSANKPNKIDSLKPDVVVQHIFFANWLRFPSKNTLPKTVRT